jgi:hypothetical protein
MAEIAAEEAEEAERRRQPLVVLENPDGTMSVGIPEGRYREFYPESKEDEDEDEGEAEGSGKISRAKGRAMDKNTFAAAQRTADMDWYRRALDRRQAAVTDGVRGFDGAGVSKWAMTPEYQQADMADNYARRLSERRAKQNWHGAKALRPFWGIGLVG